MMDSRTNWIMNKIRMGWILLAVGVVIALVGVLFEMRFADLVYNYRIITGLGILFAGIGIGYLVRYHSALKDEQSARRLSVEERDERTVLIRARAGNRAATSCRFSMAATACSTAPCWNTATARGWSESMQPPTTSTTGRKGRRCSAACSPATRGAAAAHGRSR